MPKKVKYEKAYTPPVKEATKAMRGIRACIVDKDIPEFPPTKQFFAEKAKRKKRSSKK